MEHRYWGTSTPYTDLTTENMIYLTLENSILDLTNFARNVELPFDSHGSSNADNAPVCKAMRKRVARFTWQPRGVSPKDWDTLRRYPLVFETSANLFDHYL